MKTAAVAAALVCAMLFAGCGEDSDAIELTREAEGVKLTVRADKILYEEGETIRVRAEAENVRGSELTFGFVQPDEPGLQITIDTDYTGVQILNSSDDAIGDGGTQTLAPGERVSAEADWDQMLAMYTTPQQAPAGNYVINATVMVDDPSGEGEPVPVTAGVTVRLSGGEHIIPPREAIRIATGQQEVKAWMAARQANGFICAYQPGEQFFSARIADEEVDDTEGDIYDLAVSNQRPVCTPVALEDEWRIQFFSGGTLLPKRVAVYMDINNGENPRFEESFDTPDPPPDTSSEE